MSTKLNTLAVTRRLFGPAGDKRIKTANLGSYTDSFWYSENLAILLFPSIYPGLYNISLSRLAPSRRHSSIKQNNSQTMKNIEVQLVSEPAQAENILEKHVEDPGNGSSYHETAF
jgi:hypothetical protein